MDLQYLTEAAEEFAKIVWSIRGKTKVKDIMLYGSVAKNKSDPKDLDILLIHDNLKLDEFQRILKAKKFSSDFEEFLQLEKILHIDFKKLFVSSKIMNLISHNLFHTSYVHKNYFNNSGYKKEWDNQNKDPHFLEEIIQYGKLWNPKTKHYDIPTETFYSLSELITKPQNQP